MSEQWPERKRLVQSGPKTGDYGQQCDYVRADIAERYRAMLARIGSLPGQDEFHKQLVNEALCPDRGENKMSIECVVLAEDYDRIVAALQAKLVTARLELSAERDAVAQYIGERNELQRKLADYDAGWDAAEHGEAEPPQGTKSTQWLDGYEYWKALEELETLRTQLAHYESWMNEMLRRYQPTGSPPLGDLTICLQHTIEQLAQAQTDELAQAQNEAYRDGRNKALDEVLQGCARDLTDMMLESYNLMDVGLQHAAWAHRIRANQECVRYNIVLALKSPNSAEGEPG